MIKITEHSNVNQVLKKCQSGDPPYYNDNLKEETSLYSKTFSFTLNFTYIDNLNDTQLVR